jgi:hypothetical protein
MKKKLEQVCIIDKNVEVVGSKKCIEHIKRVEREV